MRCLTTSAEFADDLALFFFARCDRDLQRQLPYVIAQQVVIDPQDQQAGRFGVIGGQPAYVL